MFVGVQVDIEGEGWMVRVKLWNDEMKMIFPTSLCSKS